MNSGSRPIRHRPGDQPVHDLRGQDADDDGQLVGRDQPAPDTGGRHLGDVHRRKVGRHPDGDAPEDPESHKPAEARAQPVRTEDKANSSAAAMSRRRRPTGRSWPRRIAPARQPRRAQLLAAAEGLPRQAEEGLEEWLGPADDDPVVAEKEVRPSAATREMSQT